MVLEKNVWNKSCLFLWDLQNELSYVKIGQQIKKFLFFGLFFWLFLHKRENTKGVTPGGENWISEKNAWSKSCFFYWNLQNELPYVKIGQQTKKFLFFGLFSRFCLHKRAKQQVRVEDWIRKNYQKQLSGVFSVCLQYTLSLTSP